MKKDDGNKGLARTVFYTDQFREFYNYLDERVRKKIDYVLLVVKD